MEAELPFLYSCSLADIEGLDAAALRGIRVAGELYWRGTGQRFTVTSARRTLKRTAELMADFDMRQLEGMYCRNGYPGYIRDIGEMSRRLGRRLTGTEVYGILRNRSEGYISSHLYGGAVDMAVEGLRYSGFLVSLLHCAGFRTLDETSLGIGCIHAGHTEVEKQIVKE